MKPVLHRLQFLLEPSQLRQLSSHLRGDTASHCCTWRRPSLLDLCPLAGTVSPTAAWNPGQVPARPPSCMVLGGGRRSWPDSRSTRRAPSPRLHWAHLGILTPLWGSGQGSTQGRDAPGPGAAWDCCFAHQAKSPLWRHWPLPLVGEGGTLPVLAQRWDPGHLYPRGGSAHSGARAPSHSCLCRLSLSAFMVLGLSSCDRDRVASKAETTDLWALYPRSWLTLPWGLNPTCPPRDWL